MFIAIGVVFFVLPVLLLLLALANEFSSSSAEDDETATADAGASNTARLLQANGVITLANPDDGTENDPEGEPLKIVGTWIFISLFAMISFGYIELTSLMYKLYKQFKDPERNMKPKNKALGGYSPEDPLRQLKMRESIYSLAFAVNLKNSKMDELGNIKEECRPSAMMRSEVNLTALFCAFCQGFTSILLLQDFIGQNSAEEEAQEDA